MNLYLFWNLADNLRYVLNNLSRDKSVDFMQNVRKNNTDGIMAYINDYALHMDSALEIAALNNNKKMVLILLKKSHANCSGILMEELLIRGNIEIADLFITKDRWWGTAFDKYQKYFQNRITFA